MPDQSTPLGDAWISDRDARAMRRLDNLISVGFPEFEPFTNAAELEFVRSYRKAYVLWQELGGADAEREQFRLDPPRS
jgi:hypothetical protein